MIQRMRKLSSALALGLAAGMGLAACGGGSGSGSAASGGNARFGSEEFGLSMDQLASKVEKVEGLIGDCMTAAGFEYVPVDFARVKEGMDADKSAPGLSDDEFIAQFGFGITTQYDHPGREIGLGEQNVQIYQALSPQEQVAYDHTLFGEDREATFAQSVEAEDFSKTACRVQPPVLEKSSASTDWAKVASRSSPSRAWS